MFLLILVLELIAFVVITRVKQSLSLGQNSRLNHRNHRNEALRGYQSSSSVPFPSPEFNMKHVWIGVDSRRSGSRDRP